MSCTYSKNLEMKFFDLLFESAYIQSVFWKKKKEFEQQDLFFKSLENCHFCRKIPLLFAEIFIKSMLRFSYHISALFSTKMLLVVFSFLFNFPWSISSKLNFIYSQDLVLYKIFCQYRLLLLVTHMKRFSDQIRAQRFLCFYWLKELCNTIIYFTVSRVIYEIGNFFCIF